MGRKAMRRKTMKSSNRALPELPQPIIHHILSFLPIKESAKTSILSKAWLSAWRTRPKLEFEPRIYFSRELKKDKSWGCYGESKYKKFRIFSQYIETTLKSYRLQNLTIDTMTLKIERMVDPGWNPLVKKCAKFAAKNGVKNLEFFLPECDLPLIVFRAESLLELSVTEGNIMELSVGEIRCHGLKRLCLEMVALDVKVFDNIMVSCPLIEVLEICYVQRIDSFKVTKANHLKELTIRLLENQRVEVEAPNLEMLTCINDETQDDMEDEDEEWMIPCCITLCNSQYQNLKSLQFTGVGINDGFFGHLGYKFPNLEDLSVNNCQKLERIKISSKSLKRIHLMTNRGLVEAQIDVPGIVVFEYFSEPDIIPELYFAATSSRWVSYIRICWREDMDFSWLLKLKELLSRLNQSEISLEINFLCNVAFNLDEIRNHVSLHVPREVQVLLLDMGRQFSLSKAHSVLDGIFCVCRPKIIKKHWLDIQRENKATKFLYEMLMFTRPYQLHNLQQKKFWQHDLKKVKVGVFDSAIYQIGAGISFIEKGKKEQQREDLNWKNFLNVLRKNGSKRRMICFKLEWVKV